MNEILNLILALVAGFLLGAFFFGGLWWTVQKGLSSKRPELWFLGSLLLRTITAVAGFYFASGGHLGEAAYVPTWIFHCTPDRNEATPDCRRKNHNQLIKEASHAT